MRRFLAWLRRRWLLVVVVTGFIVLVILQFGDLEQLVLTLFAGELRWVVATVLLQIIYYFAYAVVYQLGFATVGVESRVTELVPVLFASIFVKALVPSGGVSSLAIFVDDAAKRGQSPAKAAQGALLVLVADLAAMAPFIVYTLVFLASQGMLEAWQTLGSVLYLAFAVTLGVVIVVGRLVPDRLYGLFDWVQENVNWLASLANRPPVLTSNWAGRNARDYIGAAEALAKHPQMLFYTALVAFADDFVNLLSLYTLVLAYQEPLPVGTVTAAFSLNIVFSVVNIIPHGLGVAEGVMALVLTSLGVITTTALAITIAFRGLNVWLPLIVGFFFLRQVRTFGGGR